MQTAKPILIACCLAATPVPAALVEQPAPPLMLANVYDAEVDVAQYWVSEKYDGVRAYWDGKQLLTRSGHPIRAPDWFTAGWPGVALDGELWLDRGRFEEIVSIVRDRNPDERAWRQLRFMVFDLPAHGGVFAQRHNALRLLLARGTNDWIEPVVQLEVPDSEALQMQLQRVLSAGGEGLMLHRKDSLYRPLRSDDLLKLKPLHDAEARVVGHLPGQGKYQGMLGALLVARPDGLQFRLGTGFSDAQRHHPPEIGSWVTYSYYGLTEKGVPRFARFVRVREER